MNPTDSPAAAATAPSQRSRARARTIWLSLGGIALVGGAASYGRTLGVIQAVDGRSLLAWFEAALADPTIAAASVNLVDARQRNAKTPWFSIVSILVAASVTLGANVVYGTPDPLPRWLVNVWPPVAFLLAFESLMSYLRRGHGDAAAQVQDAESQDAQCPHGVGVDLEEAVLLAYEHGRDCEGVAPKFTELSARFGLDRKRVAEVVRGPLPEPAMNGSAAGG